MISFSIVSLLKLSLYLILKLADAELGITFVALFPTSTDVISRLEGWKCSLPLSSSPDVRSFNILSNIGIGFLARCG